MTERNQYDFDDDDLALWSASRQPQLKSDEIRGIGKNSAYRVLAVLADKEWHHTNELTKVVVRLGPRIQFLRERGYVIVEKKASNTGGLYRWNGRQLPMVDITKEWQMAYYESDHWREKRDARLSFDRYRCCWCRETEDLQVHHWVYHLFSEALSDLMTLCGPCHQQIHAYHGVKLAFPKSVLKHLHERIRTAAESRS